MTLLEIIEWSAAAALAAFTLWYQGATGWKRIAVPALGLAGCLGFAAVAGAHGLYAMAALNGALAVVHGRNLWRAWGER